MPAAPWDRSRCSRSAATAAASSCPAPTSTSWCCCRRAPTPAWTAPLERFLAFLWDIGLETGHSVRTIDDCRQEALADLGVATTLFEARLLAGPPALFDAMRRALAPDRLWSSRDFFDAKIAEQAERHHRFHDTAYNLEPNVKQGPGGLRDIQTIGWVAKRHFGVETLGDLARSRLPGAARARAARSRPSPGSGACASRCTS